MKYLFYLYSTSDLFFIYIAHQCPELNVPVNGARVCNGWKTDFGQFCLVYCGGNYSLALQYDHSQWYVCGSSGNWIASGPLPNCTGKFGWR